MKASEGRELRAQPWWTGGLLKCVGTYTVTTGEVDFGGGSGGLIFGIIVIILLLVRALISTPLSEIQMLTRLQPEFEPARRALLV